MGPTVVPKALHNIVTDLKLTVGSTEAPSPYCIKGINTGMNSLGVKVSIKTIEEVEVDVKNKIVSAPCYMMEGSILDVFNNVGKAVE
jgi:enhancing lycopene biosynthesis protein 2